MEELKAVVTRQQRNIPKTFVAQPAPAENWQYDCDRCQGRGWIPVRYFDGDRLIGQETRACDCPAGQIYRKRQQENLFSISTIPPDYLQYDNWRCWTELEARLREGKHGAVIALQGLLTHFGQAYRLSDLHPNFAIQPHPRQGVVLYGDNGVGKTALAATLAIQAMADNIPTLFVYLLDFLDDIKRTFKPNHRGKSGDELIQSAKTAQLLIIDDFNKANLSPFDIETVEKIIRHRYQRRLPLVITTNLSDKSAMTELWGRQTVSALAELCHFVWVGGVPLRNEADFNGARF